MSIKTTETEEWEVYRPGDFCVDVSKIFPGESDDWSSYASSDGFIRLSPVIYFGGVGVEGFLSLANPPSDVALDAWEASKPAGVWDYYLLLGLTSIPIGDYKSKIALYFPISTFFDRGLEVVHTFPNDTSGDDLVSCWNDLYTIFEDKFGAAPLDGKKWISPKGTLYDDSFPVAE